MGHRRGVAGKEKKPKKKRGSDTMKELMILSIRRRVYLFSPGGMTGTWLERD